MRWVFLSPHFDDVALSCGGLLWALGQRGERAEIWTVCAGFPEPGPLSDFALRTHAIWGTGDGRQTVELRRSEDRAAASLLGVGTQHFTTLDCIYRADAAGSFLYLESVFSQPQPADAGLPARIASELAQQLLPGDRVVCPLGVGDHVDHVLTRAAGELLQRPLAYYADFPYVLRSPEQLATLTQNMRRKVRRIAEPGLVAWQNSIAAYASQLPQLFGTEAEMRKQVHEYWAAYRGIRLWTSVNRAETSA